MEVWNRVKGFFDGPGTQFISIDGAASQDTELDKSDLITSAIAWLAKGITQSVPTLKFANPSLLHVIEQPSTQYSGEDLITAVTADLCIRGTSYVRIIRSRNKLLGLMWLPKVDEATRDGKFSGYTYYNSNFFLTYVPTKDMIVFKRGLDSENLRRGISPLRNLLDEVLTDGEAANFTHSLIKNLPIPGLLIGPKEGVFSAKSSDQHKKLEASFQKHFTGNERGKASLITHAFEIGYVQPDMSKIDLARLRELPEERVCAALGIQPAVLGLGAGLQTTKVGATMVEMTRQSWRYGVIPLIKTIQNTYNKYLVDRFDTGNKLELSVSGIDDLRMPIPDIISLFQAGLISKLTAANLAGVPDDGSGTPTNGGSNA